MEDLVTSMSPKIGDDTITLPITLEYSGTKKKTSRKRIQIAIIMSVICIIGIVLISIGKNTNIVQKVIFSLVLFTVFQVVIRFIVLKENVYRKERKLSEEKDFKKESKSFWSIYSIDTKEPYVVHFKNGDSGLVVKLIKDVIIGKQEEAMYSHGDGISEAYNILGRSKLKAFYHVDYMDVVGTDERLEKSLENASNIKNPDFRSVLVDVFSNLKSDMEDVVTTYDAYVFIFKGDVEQHLYTIESALNAMLKANYVDYQILNGNNLAEYNSIVKILFNLKDFSSKKAMNNCFTKTSNISAIRPIALYGDGSEVIINKTSQEIREEREQKEKEREGSRRKGKR